MNRLVEGASSAFLTRLLGLFFTFVLMICLARILGEEKYGVYVFVLAWLRVAVVFSNLGTDILLLRYVTVYRVSSSYNELKGILRATNLLALGTSCCIALAVTAFLRQVLGGLDPQLMNTFWGACVVLPLLALTSLQQSSLRSSGEVARALIPELILHPLITGLFVTVLYITGSSAPSAAAVMVSFCLAVACSFIVGAKWLRASLPAPAREAVPRYHLKEWLKTSLPMMLVTGFFILTTRTDTLMIGILSNATQAGIYNTTSRIAVLIQFGMLSVQIRAGPMIAELYERKKPGELQRLLHLSAAGGTLFAIVIAFAFLVLGRWILGFWGQAFEVGYVPLLILSAGQVANAATGMTGLTMTMTGRQNILAWVLGSTAAGNIILNLLLIPLWGNIGAATSTLVASAVWNVFIVLYVRRKMGFDLLALRGFSRLLQAVKASGFQWKNYWRGFE